MKILQNITMKNKIFKILTILCLSFFISDYAAAATSCSWTKSATNRTQTQVGDEIVVSEREECPTGTTLGGGCSGTTPAGSMCCCVKAASTSASAPRFKLPDYNFQIDLPGLSKLSTVDCTDTCEIPWISQYIVAVYNYGLTVVGIIAVLVLMAAGLLWIVSAGDSEKINKAKQLIVGSITGILLMISMNLFLAFINPDLVKMKSITLDKINEKLDSLATSKNNSTIESYKNAGCATDEELKNGVDVYATGYYKPAYKPEDPNFLCVVAMQCSCPNGQDTTKNCDHLYGKSFPNYRPCKSFDSKTAYRNMTASGSEPKIGDIAGPNNCSNLPKGSSVCFKGQTYKITDAGGGIKGKRIDIWSGNNLDKAYAETGVGKLTIGACK